MRNDRNSHSGNPTTRRSKLVVMIAFALTICSFATGLALADNDHRHGNHWRHHGNGGHNRYWSRGPDVYYAPQPNYYYAPRRYYYAPPPVVYYPRPRSGLDLFFGVR